MESSVLNIFYKMGSFFLGYILSISVFWNILPWL